MNLGEMEFEYMDGLKWLSVGQRRIFGNEALGPLSGEFLIN
jgi:hypothetical protein